MAGLEPTTINRGRAPDLIPGYRLETLLGRGGMGEVYRATQLSLNRRVAVKVLSTELAKDASFVTRFEKEAAALATLSHPHIVDIVDKGRAQDTYYLVMEYIDGPSLREQMRSPLLDALSSLRMILEICRGVEYAHSRGVIHRDLKPENILFDEQAGGIAKVTDFGLASFAEHAGERRFNVTETHVAMGTISYMAPEQRVDARKADHRADIYSLGVILYELLVGDLPMGQFDPPTTRKPGLDPRVDAIVSRCLKPDPDERYDRVAELIADLEPLVPLSSTRPATRPIAERSFVRSVKNATRATLRAIATAVVFAAMVVLAISWFRSNRPPEDPFAGAAMTRELSSRPLVNGHGRIEKGASHRRIGIGDGPDTVPLLSFGRDLDLEGTSLVSRPQPGAPVGRIQPDVVDLEGPAVRWMAHVTAHAEDDGALSVLRRLIFGEPPATRGALLLQGTTGRYASVSLSRPGEPVMFEWALGERRGVMLGVATPERGTAQLELTIDHQGVLRAFIGEGEDRRGIAEPVVLGPDWLRSFGGEIRPALGCLEGTCRYDRGVYELAKEAPPPPPPVIEVVEAPVESSKVTPVAKPAVKKTTVAPKVAPAKSTKTSTTPKKKRTR